MGAFQRATIPVKRKLQNSEEIEVEIDLFLIQCIFPISSRMIEMKNSKKLIRTNLIAIKTKLQLKSFKFVSELHVLAKMELKSLQTRSCILIMIFMRFEIRLNGKIDGVPPEGTLTKLEKLTSVND